jgi:6-phosphofructo-2-kinase / fructose-2,6-biphosphatase 3
MRLAVDSESEEEVEVEEDDLVPVSPGLLERRKSLQRRKRVLVEKNKLVIIMVGLPGRGKTFLCNKIKAYLTWLGHTTRHFNVGMYRRMGNKDGAVQDASFFSNKNAEGMQMRQEALDLAILDMMKWLLVDPNAQVAIFDATNTTDERREYLRGHLHGKVQYLFIESICDDHEVLELNYKYKMLYSPDYDGINTDQALLDFRNRIHEYEAVYEPITQDYLHYIKLINMVTGRGQMILNRISGYIAGKLVFFLMQICKHGLTKPRKIWLSRHGESEYNNLGLIGGDSDISPLGQKYAVKIADELLERIPETLDGIPLPVSVWTSTLKRTIQTAQHLVFPKLRWKALDEIQAGEMEGMTYEEIERKSPEEFEARKRDKLTYRYPRGESYLDLIQRLEPVIIEVERERECVCIIGHQAVLRVLYGYFMNIPQEKIPTLSIPLHTLIELTPKPDGSMYEERFVVDIHSQRPSAKHSRKSSAADMPSRVPTPALSGAKPSAPIDMVPKSLPGSHPIVSYGNLSGGNIAMQGLSLDERSQRARAISNTKASLRPSGPTSSRPASLASEGHHVHHRRQSSYNSVLEKKTIGGNKNSKSTIDLSQLLPSQLPNANQDVLSVHDVKVMQSDSFSPNPQVVNHSPIVDGRLLEESNPAHPKHPGNFTPNQMSPASSPGKEDGFSSRRPRATTTHALFYGERAEDSDENH